VLLTIFRHLASRHHPPKWQTLFFHAHRLAIALLVRRCVQGAS
jgi:hypothetical protein